MTRTAIQVAASALLLAIVASLAWRVWTANAYGNWWANASILHYGLAIAGAIFFCFGVIHGLRMIWRKGEKS